MRQTCVEPDCGLPIVSDNVVKRWFHRVGDRLDLVHKGHRAKPAGVALHECEHPDPACSGDGCGREAHRQWMARELARQDGHERPMPGLIPSDGARRLRDELGL